MATFFHQSTSISQSNVPNPDPAAVAFAVVAAAAAVLGILIGDTAGDNDAAETESPATSLG